MKARHDWDKQIGVVEKFFALQKLPESIRLNAWSMITDTNLFITSHIGIVKYHNGENIYKPYLERLFELKKILEDGRGQ